MSTDLQTTTKAKGLLKWIQAPEMQKQIAAAIGDIMPPSQFISHMLVAFNEENVRNCSEQSKLRAFMECAALGMVPTSGQVALIPYGTEIKAMPQWQGFKAVMERHPDILEVVGVLVHITDTLSIVEGDLRHSYDPFDEGREFRSPKDIRGGYCKIVYRDGRPPKYHMVPRKTIEQAQACAQTQKLWKAWYYEMALKTLYRNAYARRAVPIDPLVNNRLEQAIKVDDLNLGNDPLRIQSEGYEDHMEQARQQREASEPPYNPPTPEEQTAAETSQVNPAVENADGVDEPPCGRKEYRVADCEHPEPTSEEEEAHIAKKIGAAKNISAVNEALELAGDGHTNPWVGPEAVERLKKKAENQRVLIRSKRGPNAKNKPVE